MAETDIFDRLPRILQQIQSLASDPGAADLVRSGALVAADLERLMHLQLMASAMQRRVELMQDLHGLMIISTYLNQGAEGAEETRRGLDQEALARLPMEVLSASRIERMRSGKEDPVCTVCYEEYAPGHCVTSLPCGHVFCAGCCREWLSRSGTCPVCRMSLLDGGEPEAADAAEARAPPGEAPQPEAVAQGSPLVAVRRARRAEPDGAAAERGATRPPPRWRAAPAGDPPALGAPASGEAAAAAAPARAPLARAPLARDEMLARAAAARRPAAGRAPRVSEPSLRPPAAAASSAGGGASSGSEPSLPAAARPQPAGGPAPSRSGLLAALQQRSQNQGRGAAQGGTSAGAGRGPPGGLPAVGPERRRRAAGPWNRFVSGG